MKPLRLDDYNGQPESLSWRIFTDAMEIIKDDHDFRHTDFAGFCRVMWPDSQHDDYNVSRATYNDALVDAYDLFNEQRHKA